MDALDPQRPQRLAEEDGVIRPRVLEAGRRDRLAEVRQVGGDRAQPDAGGCFGQRPPVVGGARIAVDEDDCLGGSRRPRPQDADPGPPHLDPGDLRLGPHRPQAEAARACGACPRRREESAQRALTATARGSVAANIRSGRTRRVPSSSNLIATLSSRAAAAKSSRSTGLRRRPVA